MIDSTSSGIREFKCKAGYYGNQEGMSDEKCSGPCDPGTFCLLGSTVATPCPTGHLQAPAPEHPTVTPGVVDLREMSEK